MQVRVIETLDSHSLAPLLEEANTEGFDFIARLEDEYKSGLNRFNRQGEILFAVYEDEKMIAIGGLNNDPYLDDPLVGRVRHIYVLNAFRGKGAGRLLLKAIIEEARRHYAMITLKTETEEASLFYQSLGFVTEPEIESATHHLSLV